LKGIADYQQSKSPALREIPADTVHEMRHFIIRKQIVLLV